MSDKVKIVKINVDEQEELSEKFKVESMPTLILFKNGQELNRIVGVKDKESIVEAIKSELLMEEVKWLDDKKKKFNPLSTDWLMGNVGKDSDESQEEEEE